MSLAARLNDLIAVIGYDIKAVQDQLGDGAILLDPWHKVDTAGEPVFKNSWTNYTAITQLAQFRKDPFGVVKLSGYVKGGATATAIFTLPVGYRPVDQVAFSCYASAGNCLVTVDPNGDVKATTVSGSITTLTSLDDVEFDTEAVSQITTFMGPEGPKGDPGDSVMVPMDGWHRIGTAGEPAFQNSWVNFDVVRPARFRKYPDGKVRLQGIIKTGASGTTAFTLPAGYRPPSTVTFPVIAAASTAYISIADTGIVAPATVGGNVSTYAYLDGIEFDTESVTEYAVGPRGEPGPALVNVTAHTFLPSYDAVEEALIGYGDITTEGRPDFDHYFFTSVETVDPELSSPSGLMYVQTCIGLYSPEKVWRRYRVGNYISTWVRLNDVAARVVLNKSTTTSLTTAIETSVAFNVEEEDVWGFHSGSDIWAIVPSGLGGMYIVSFEVWYASNATNARYTRMYRDRGGVVNNFASDIRQGSLGGVATIVTVTQPIDLQAGDKVWPSLYQNSGATLVTPANTTKMRLVRVGNI